MINQLELALESSRYAFHLNKDNAEVIFNLAQLLTSYSEVSQGALSAIAQNVYSSSGMEIKYLTGSIGSWEHNGPYPPPRRSA